MSLSRKRSRQRATLIGAAIGVVIIVTFVLSLIAPGSSSRTSTSSDDLLSTPLATAIVVPTPEPDPQVVGGTPYIHHSGLFRVFRPAGQDWVLDENASVSDSAIASVVIQNTRRLVVIHNYIRPHVEYETPQALSENFLTVQHFAGAWQDYAQWEETARSVQEDKVVVDFNLNQLDVDYIARVAYWVQDGWLFVARVVTPANNPLLLDRLFAQVEEGFVGFEALMALPVNWTAQVDQRLGYILRHPNDWRHVAGDAGRPVTFVVETEAGTLRARAWAEADTPLADEEAARAWLVENRDEAEVLAAQPMQRGAGAGWALAYTFLSTTGDPLSGLALLLNDDAGTLFVADLQVPALEVNLLDADAVEALDDVTATARQALLEGFWVLDASLRVPEE